MEANPVTQDRRDGVARQAERAPGLVADLVIGEFDVDLQRVALPVPGIQIVARFQVGGELDVHALGMRESAHRKQIRGGQRAVMARLHLDAAPAALGVPAALLTGRIVAIDDLWSPVESRRLHEELAATRDSAGAAAVLDRAIAARASAPRPRTSRARLALAAAARLSNANVSEVADALGVSERELRRAFHETVGIGPKTFSKLTRFHRALDAARGEAEPNWARIAASAGYYDQAHLIAEFRAVTGVPPRALLRELATTRGRSRT